MRRRAFITLLGGAAAWPLAARAQQRAMPVIGFLEIRSPETITARLRAFRQGLKETGYVEGENIAIEYRWAEQMERLPDLAAQLVRRQVAVIVTAGGFATARAAKDATMTIPIVFGVSDDPVKHGLVASLARPGGNLTGVNLLSTELTAKRLELLREMLPGASRVAVLVNPGNTGNTQTTLREVDAAGRAIGFRRRSSMRAPAAKSIRPSRHSPASSPTPSSSGKMHFSMAGASSSRIGRRAMRCR
jgi:putative ABC transport system substrate-binding protein